MLPSDAFVGSNRSKSREFGCEIGREPTSGEAGQDQPMPIRDRVEFCEKQGGHGPPVDPENRRGEAPQWFEPGDRPSIVGGAIAGEERGADTFFKNGEGLGFGSERDVRRQNPVEGGAPRINVGRDIDEFLDCLRMLVQRGHPVDGQFVDRQSVDGQLVHRFDCVSLSVVMNGGNPNPIEAREEQVMDKPTVLVDGLAFGEGPRWRNDRLYYSDMHRQVVESVTLDGVVEHVCDVPNDPSGLGWLPDGRLVIASMRDRAILRQETTGEVVVHADLSDLASWYVNDLVVDGDGRIYVGNFGFDLHGDSPMEFAPAELIIVEPDGRAHVADSLMAFPNGSVITPDGNTLIVAQSFGRDLVAFDRASDGSLSGRRQWADLDGRVPDGICLDAENAVWFADPVNGGCVRVAEGGKVLDELPTDQLAFACMLGGPEGHHLFVLTASNSHPDEAKKNLDGQIIVVKVESPHAGRP